MITLNTNPSTSELRLFGGLWLPIFLCIVAGVLWRQGVATAPTVLVASAALISLTGLLKPSLVKPVFVGMIVLTFPIGWVVSHLMLGFVFYGVVTPIGLILRLVGHDPMNRGFDPAAATYWVEREQVEDSSRYFKQF